MPNILLLDAMGVLYEPGDDVGELLVPFVHRHGHAGLSANVIEQDYVEASLGRLDVDLFWQRMGVDPALEDGYIAGHRLVEGTQEALAALEMRFTRMACLSNGVTRWSLKLRQRFDLDPWIGDWILSGDIGLRKPAAGIYQHALDRLGAPPQDIVFIDDRPANLDAAKALGLGTVLLDIRGVQTDCSHRHIRRLAELI